MRSLAPGSRTGHRAPTLTLCTCAATQLRSRIMPINRTYPLRVLMDACRRYNGARPLPPLRRVGDVVATGLLLLRPSPSTSIEAAAASTPAERDRRITFEYVMLKVRVTPAFFRPGAARRT